MNCGLPNQDMKKNGYHFDFLCWDDEPGEYEEEAKSFGNVIRIQPPKYGYFKLYRNIKRIISDNGGYDIVHSHVYFITGLVLFAAAKSDVSVRIAHSHSVRRKDDKKIFRKFYCWIMRKLINKYATAKCACSNEAGCNLFGKDVFNATGIVLPNVVDLSLFSFSTNNKKLIRSELNILDSQIVIGHVGHMLPVKNQLFLLDVFNMFVKNNYNAVLVMVGNGPERDRIIRKIVDLKIEDSVILTGTRKDVDKIMSAFDIFILPSIHEGLPLTTVEAMANGLSYVMEKDVVADEIASFSNSIKVEGYNVKSWYDAINNGISKGRYDSSRCIENLKMFGVEHFEEILTKLYSLK